MNYLICGYLGYENLGDELMAQAISSSVFLRDKNARITFFAPKGKKYSDFECINRHSAIQILKSMKECDVFILGGGTLISEQSSKRSAFYYCFMLSLAYLMKKKRIMFSCGVDTIKSKILKRILKNQLKSTKISLRDSASLEALWEFSHCPSAKIHADSVFLLTKYHQDFKAREKNTVTVCLKSGAPADIAIMIGDFCQRHSLCAVFVATSPKDMPICEKQAALIGARATLLSDYENARSVFESSLLCLSMRYHALVLCSCFECIPISMSDSEKIVSLMREMRISDLILPCEYSAKKYESTLEKALASAKKYTDLCKSATKEMLRRAELAEAFLWDINFSE